MLDANLLHSTGTSTSGTQEALEALVSTGASELAITELDIAGASSEDYVNVRTPIITQGVV